MAPLLALLLALSPADAAVAGALAVPGARVEVRAVRVTSGRACAAAATGAEALRPVAASGEVPLRLTGVDAAGAGCAAWAWARVRVFAPAATLARAVAAGEPLEGAVRPGEAEVLPGRAPLAALPPGAVAARALAAGAAVAAADLSTGPRPGDAVEVVVRAGAVELTQTARALPCVRGRACALLASGRRVEGRLERGRVVVEAP